MFISLLSLVKSTTYQQSEVLDNVCNSHCECWKLIFVCVKFQWKSLGDRWRSSSCCEREEQEIQLHKMTNDQSSEIYFVPCIGNDECKLCLAAVSGGRNFLINSRRRYFPLNWPQSLARDGENIPVNGTQYQDQKNFENRWNQQFYNFIINSQCRYFPLIWPQARVF